ncbi:hypothetical protein ACFQ3N_01640 [Virgibacillus byunsanensis]|uniref:LXG domain-containing protein n=1 Tax=Virgibacillus byunsanensis TaxID=570945 RepID=A0ABW3LFF9_9BACI
MTELNDFMYELNGFASQSHILKDKYDKLTDSEKKMVMNLADSKQTTPPELFQQVITWMEAMHEQLGSELLPPLTTLTGCLKWGLLG